MSEADAKLDTPKVRPWRWPGEWFRDEKFWREVTARAFSGLIVLAAAYWGAIGFGFIQNPEVIQRSFYIVGVLGNVLLLLAAAYICARRLTRQKVLALARELLGILILIQFMKPKRRRRIVISIFCVSYRVFFTVCSVASLGLACFMLYRFSVTGLP